MKLTGQFILLLLTITATGQTIKARLNSETLPVLQQSVTGSLYARMPEMTVCDPGLLTTQARDELIRTVNEIRSLHNLPPVRHDPDLEGETRQAALIVAANRTMNHTPPKDYICWTKTGRTGSWNSNLYYHLYSAWAPSITEKNRNRRLREIGKRM